MGPSDGLGARAPGFLIPGLILAEFPHAGRQAGLGEDALLLLEVHRIPGKAEFAGACLGLALDLAVALGELGDRRLVDLADDRRLLLGVVFDLNVEPASVLRQIRLIDGTDLVDLGAQPLGMACAAEWNRKPA
nr:MULTISPECIES: hypothetical protein [Acidiphilium]